MENVLADHDVFVAGHLFVAVEMDWFVAGDFILLDFLVDSVNLCFNSCFIPYNLKINNLHSFFVKIFCFLFFFLNIYPFL